MIQKTKLEIKQDKLVKAFMKYKAKSNVKPKRKKKPKKKFKTKSEYYAELKDERWIKKRNKILKLDEYKCRYCGSKYKLTVHHKTYIGVRKAWDYSDELLIIVYINLESQIMRQ